MIIITFYAKVINRETDEVAYENYISVEANNASIDSKYFREKLNNELYSKLRIIDRSQYRVEAEPIAEISKHQAYSIGNERNIGGTPDIQIKEDYERIRIIDQGNFVMNSQYKLKELQEKYPIFDEFNGHYITHDDLKKEKIEKLKYDF